MFGFVRKSELNKIKNEFKEDLESFFKEESHYLWSRRESIDIILSEIQSEDFIDKVIERIKKKQL